MQIKNKIAIVTGASMGIGQATARLLAEKGATVVLAARSVDKLEAIAKDIPNSLVIPTDMTDSESIINLMDETLEKFGRVDILVNNAGRGLYAPVESFDVNDYREIFELNVIGPLIAMQEAIPIMRKQGGGRIVNISSMVSKNYFPYLGGYASTKYALNALSLTARAELAEDGIIVSVVHPGLTDTEFGVNAIKTPETEEMAPRNREGMPAPDSAEYVAGKIIENIENDAAEQYMHEDQASSAS